MAKREPNSKLQDAHRARLAKRSFCKGRNLVGFTKPELDILDRYGYWLCALASGEIPAISDAQRRFQAAASLKRLPQPPFETVWVKYIRHQKRVDEAARKNACKDRERESFDPNKGNVTPSRLGNLSYGKLAPYEPVESKPERSDDSSD